MMPPGGIVGENSPIKQGNVALKTSKKILGG